jgi:hypothetical protein
VAFPAKVRKFVKSPGGALGTGVPSIYDIPGLQKVARKTAALKMSEPIRSVNFGSVKYETVFTEGSPVIITCALAKDHNVDLVMTNKFRESHASR